MTALLQIILNILCGYDDPLNYDILPRIDKSYNFLFGNILLNDLDTKIPLKMSHSMCGKWNINQNTYVCKYHQTSNIKCTKCQNLDVSRLILLLFWSQVLSQEWRCSWSWVINNFIAF